MASFASGAQPVGEMPSGNPLESSYNRLYSVMGKFDLYGNYTMDPLLRSRRELVAQIFSMVDYPDNLELSVAALRIIQDMASSPQFDPLPGSPHKLYTILEDAGSLAAIQSAFMNRLEREEDERLRLLTPESVQALLDSDLGAAYEFGLANIVRLQILDFFIQNCTKPGYNLAHFLLGFSAQQGVKATVLDESVDSCLFLILDILDFGLGKPGSPVVCQEHPSLSAKAYELVATLLNGRATSKPMLRLFSNPASRFNDFLSRHFSLSSRELLDPSDIYLTAHELKGKAAVFRSYALELNINAQIRKEDIKLSHEIVSEYLHSIKAASHPVMLGPEDQLEFSASITEYVQSLSKLLQVYLFGNKSDTPRMITSIEAIILHFVKDSNLPLDAREALGSLLLLCVSLDGKYQQGQELLSTLIEVICQADSSFVLRGYMYSAFTALSCEYLSGKVPLLKGSSGRIIEMVIKDLISVGNDLDAWKTLATTFLTHFIKFVPTVCTSLSQLGHLRTLVKLISPDEASIKAYFSSATQPLNSIYLWKAKMSLLKGLVLSSVSAMELLAEAGLLEQLTNLTFIDRSIGEANIMTSNGISAVEVIPTQMQHQFNETVESVLSLVVLIAQQNLELKNASIHRGLLLFIGGHFDLLSRQLVLKTGPKSKSALLSFAADLVSYAGPELIPVAAKHGISLRHVVTNMLVKALLAIEHDSLTGEPSEVTAVSLDLCAHSLQFIAASRLQNPASSPALVDFDELAADQLTLQGKLPISIIERLLIAFNRIMNTASYYRLSLKVFEQLIFIVLIDLEERLNQETTASKPFTYSPTVKTAKPQDLLRPALLRHLEAFSQSTASKPDAAADQMMQTCKRWVRQLMFALRKE